MEANKVATIITTAVKKHGLEVQSQKNFTKVQSKGGARIYVKEATKDGEIRKIQLSHWGYGGLPKGLELPNEAIRKIDSNGAVSMEIDLSKTPPDFFQRLIDTLPDLKEEADPRRQGRGRRGAGSGQAQKLSQLLATAQQKGRAKTSQAQQDSAEDGQRGQGSRGARGGGAQEASSDEGAPEEVEDQESGPVATDGDEDTTGMVRGKLMAKAGDDDSDEDSEEDADDDSEADEDSDDSDD